MGLVVRMVEPTDADRRAMAAIRRWWREEDVGGPIDDPGFEDRAAAWIETNASHRLGWLAELDAKPVGMLTMIIVERMPIPGAPLDGWGYVHHFVVDPTLRSQGIGKALMDAAAEEGRARGWKQLVLHPRDRSIPFYQREGFEPSDLMVRQL